MDDLMRRRIRVMHAIPGLEAGGAEGQLLSLGRWIEQQGIEQWVVSMTPGGALRDAFESTFGNLHDLGMQRGAISPKVVAKFCRIVRLARPDVIHAWMYHACMLSAVSPITVPTVWGIRHGLDAPEHLRPMTRFIVRTLPALSFRARAIVFNSAVSRNQHKELGYPVRKSHVVANGVDTNRFMPDAAKRLAGRRDLEVPAGHRVIGFLGRLHLVKGWDLFCAATAYVRKERDDVTFVMAASGTESDEITLARLLNDLGIASSVRFVGFEKDVPKFLAALDVLVSPSRSEGFPNAVVEAMACGVPCVATDVGVNSEIIGNAGVLVDPDAESIGLGILKLLNLDVSEFATIAAAARQRAVVEFGLNSTASALGKIYEECLPG
jgi:glycosyltransferase involved in cell wall biosynthesis